VNGRGGRCRRRRRDSVAILQTPIGDEPVTLAFIPKHHCNRRFRWTGPGTVHGTADNMISGWPLGSSAPGLNGSSERCRAAGPEVIPQTITGTSVVWPFHEQ
jgi:hypothetical protein